MKGTEFQVSSWNMALQFQDVILTLYQNLLLMHNLYMYGTFVDFNISIYQADFSQIHVWGEPCAHISQCKNYEDKGSIPNIKKCLIHDITFS